MKALTLHQPWASLVTLGVKTIETRSWSTKYRGPLAIHAGRSTDEMGGVAAGRMCREEDAAICSALVDHGVRQMADLPLGAIVATCTLTDVVPIDPPSYTGADNLVRPFPERHPYVAVIHHNDPLGRRSWEWRREGDYGHFTRGRLAWLLDDIKATTERCPACWGTGWICDSHSVGQCALCPEFDGSLSGCPVCTPPGGCGGSGRCEPIPARGRQGLWTWTP